MYVTNLLLFEHQQTKKLLVSWQFSGTYGVTKYGSGWRKDVVNQCLEFGGVRVPPLLVATRTNEITATATPLA